MKELSIEEKAKAYDDAIDKIKYVMEHGVSPTLNKEDLQDIFPELKESEDERMIKFIKKQLFKIKKAITENYELDAKLTKAIDWLEKQGEKSQGKLAIEATKEQRDQLEKAMNDAGYTFDFEKKELKKIEQKPAWSEEDEDKILLLENICDDQINSSASYSATNRVMHELKDWLKSIRHLECWKPSEEQMKALHDINLTEGISYAGQGQTLIELYNDLKKLKGE